MRAFRQPVIDDFIARVTEKNPDIERIIEILSQEFSLSAPEAEALFSHLVAELNSRYFPQISNLEIIHTERCNLACNYCFEASVRGRNDISEQMLTKAVDLLFRYSADAQALSITHFGGEPLLNFAAVTGSTDYALKRAKEAGKTIEFNMTSNCVALTEDMAYELALRKIRVLASIDGLSGSHDSNRVDKNGHGTFTRVLKAINILKKHQQWVGGKITVVPENAGSLYDDVKGLYDLGINQFVIGHATGVLWSDEAFEAYSASIKKIHAWYVEGQRKDLKINYFDNQRKAPFFGCRAGNNSIAISAKGDIFGCSKLMPLDADDSAARLGSVEYGLTHLHNRFEMVDCTVLKKECEKAALAQTYLGGCFATNHFSTGDMYKPDLQEQRFLELQMGFFCPGEKNH